MLIYQQLWGCTGIKNKRKQDIYTTNDNGIEY